MKTKRFLAFLLAFVLAVSTVPPASAADSDFTIQNGVLIEYRGVAKDVVIPDGVTVIGENAFYRCDSVTSITIPNSVTSIGSEAFSRCHNLTSIIIPDSVRFIGDSAFSYCSKLTSVVLPHGLTRISDVMFGSCKALTNITIPDSVTSIGQIAFYGCASLTSITIPNSVTTISQGAFNSCTGLTNFTIPDGVTTIKDNVFANCTNLTSIAFGSSVASIGKNAFYNCPNLTNVTFKGVVKNVHSTAFDGTPWKNNGGTVSNSTSTASSSTSDFEIDGTKLVKYTGPGGDVVIPDGITTIAWNAFIGNKKVTSVTMPDSVTTLEMNAESGPFAAGFANCTNLKSVRLSKNLKKSSVSFSGCTSLGSVVIPDNFTAISDRMFYNCTSLKSITLPDSVTTIRNFAFAGCTSLTEINGGRNITRIYDSALVGVPWVTQCRDDYVMLGHYLLKYQGASRDVVVPEGTTWIDCCALVDCDHVKTVTLPSSLEGAGAIGWSKNSRPSSAVAGPAWVSKFAFPRKVVTITFPKEGKLVEDLANMSRLDFVSAFETGSSGMTSVENLVNCPNQEVIDYMARNHNYLTSWANPGSYIRYYGSDRVTKLAQEITTGLTTDYEKAKTIYGWVSQNLRYDASAPNNLRNADKILDQMSGVCDDFAYLVYTLCRAVNIPTQIVIGIGYGDLHAWNVIFADGRWFWADATTSNSKTDWERFDSGSMFMTADHKPNSTAPYTAAADIPSDWAQSEVWEGICSYIVPYDLQSDYRGAITREEFCRLMTTLVEKSTGKDIKSYAASRGLTITDPFTDTDSPEVLAAHALGIVNGTSGTTFNPNGSITRQEAAAMLARTGRLLGLASGQGVSFTDAGKFANWAGSEIAFVSGLVDPVSSSRVMNGVSANEFNPQGAYTREQAIMTALRLFHCAA